MVSVFLPSDALLQHLLSCLGLSYLGHGVSLHSCSSKAQLLLLTLEEGYLLTTAPPDLDHEIAPLGPPAPWKPPLLGCGVAPPSCHPWPRRWGSSSQPFLRRCSLALSAAAPDLGRGGTPLGRLPLRHAVFPASAPDLGPGVAAPLGRAMHHRSRPHYEVTSKNQVLRNENQRRWLNSGKMNYFHFEVWVEENFH